MKELVLRDFILFDALAATFFIGGFRLENIVILADPALQRDQLLDGQAAGLDVVNDLVEFSIRRSNERSNAYVELARRRWKRPWPIAPQIGSTIWRGYKRGAGTRLSRRKLLLAHLALSKRIAECIGESLWIERFTIEANHFLFGATNEVMVALCGWKLAKRFRGGEHLGFQ